ncbi:hypothetical protein [Microcoleus vaginatus]|uniref:hypothetical protein n=1 Tax=Microcoleus vaginatus TaxID=119532 RepID=UPI001688055C|nr:hypothetical protein [Microcoleus sp. FACHB-84]MBD2009213.1 hypothetical protein [Microcoleus sp. FACHB-45]
MTGKSFERIYRPLDSAILRKLQLLYQILYASSLLLLALSLLPIHSVTYNRPELFISFIWLITNN